MAQALQFPRSALPDRTYFLGFHTGGKPVESLSPVAQLAQKYGFHYASIGIAERKLNKLVYRIQEGELPYGKMVEKAHQTLARIRDIQTSRTSLNAELQRVASDNPILLEQDAHVTACETDLCHMYDNGCVKRLQMLDQMHIDLTAHLQQTIYPQIETLCRQALAREIPQAAALAQCQILEAELQKLALSMLSRISTTLEMKVNMDDPSEARWLVEHFCGKGDTLNRCMRTLATLKDAISGQGRVSELQLKNNYPDSTYRHTLFKRFNEWICGCDYFSQEEYEALAAEFEKAINTAHAKQRAGDSTPFQTLVYEAFMAPYANMPIEKEWAEGIQEVSAFLQWEILALRGQSGLEALGKAMHSLSTAVDDHLPKEVLAGLDDLSIQPALRNRIYGNTYFLAKEAGLPTDHGDFGRVAFRAEQGRNVPNQIRYNALRTEMFHLLQILARAGKMQEAKQVVEKVLSPEDRELFFQCIREDHDSYVPIPSVAEALLFGGLAKETDLCRHACNHLIRRWDNRPKAAAAGS
jgi:hypothetical protein